MTPSLAPAAGLVLRAALALLFLSSAAHKLRDPQAFRLVLQRYELIPWAWAGGAATLVAVLEAAIVAGVLFSARVAFAGGLLLAVYAGAIAINLRRGRRDIDCGCAGPARRVPLGWGLVMRNLVLIALALAATLPSGDRALVWIDAVSVGAAVVFLALFYAAVETALANAARGAHPAHGRPLQESV